MIWAEKTRNLVELLIIELLIERSTRGVSGFGVEWTQYSTEKAARSVPK